MLLHEAETQVRMPWTIRIQTHLLWIHKHTSFWLFICFTFQFEYKRTNTHDPNMKKSVICSQNLNKQLFADFWNKMSRAKLRSLAIRKLSCEPAKFQRYTQNLIKWGKKQKMRKNCFSEIKIRSLHTFCWILFELKSGYCTVATNVRAEHSSATDDM